MYYTTQVTGFEILGDEEVVNGSAIHIIRVFFPGIFAPAQVIQVNVHGTVTVGVRQHEFLTPPRRLSLVPSFRGVSVVLEPNFEWNRLASFRSCLEPEHAIIREVNRSPFIISYAATPDSCIPPGFSFVFLIGELLPLMFKINPQRPVLRVVGQKIYAAWISAGL